MITINFQSGFPSQSVDIAIGNQTYTLRTKWNERFSFWSLSIFDRESTAIVTGIRMVRDYPLIGYLSLSQFDGDFVYLRAYGTKEEPDFDSMGTDFTLVYVTGDELDAAISENG
ncbi:hypothetical protein [Pantoea sp. BAV 3049]|uniref:phage baseplate plug family protein n=1 Tax=Pantoea sp. BAV 3049 TaxID=2654188 RepID=UPI00131C6FB7|nr:hypothetical protein [Pantoea sp. BAV 3049]